MRNKLNIFVAAAVLLCGTVGAAVLNEWTFETDASNQMLSQAVNSGTDGGLFVGTNHQVTQTDGAGGLVCANDASGVAGLWTEGAVLTAAVTPSGAGEIRYLRYDVEYDVTASGNDSGTLIGLGFAQGSQTRLAGFALRYRVGNPSPPTGVVETTVETGLALTGRISVIAEVNLTARTLTAWYDLSGGNVFDFGAPSATVNNLALTSIDQLELRVTGDLINGGSEPVVFDNIRTASTWEEITDPVADYSKPPVPVITIFDDQMDGRMLVGQTNEVQVVIKNTVSPATTVSSTLTVDSPSDFTILSFNVPQAVGVNQTVTNTYQVIAHTNGEYQFTARAVADGINSQLAELKMLVGSRITASLHVIANEVGGIILGRIEPGETFDLVIRNLNSGAVIVANITNSLTAVNSSFFPTITPADSNIPDLLVGESAVTTYRVTCSANTPAGLQTFAIVNRTANKVWTNYFEVDVFRESFLQMPPAVTLNAIAGQPISIGVELVNEGNVRTSFAASDGGRFVESYVVESQSVPRIGFGPVGYDLDTTFAAWDETRTVPLDIGFDFSLFGTEYQTFSVSQKGFLTLISTNESTANVIPFQRGSLVDQSTVRYERLSGNRLAVAWGNTYSDDRETLEFQVILNSNGTIQYLYESGTWSEGEIGLTNRAGDNQDFNHVPGQFGRDALLLTPESWLTVSPETGSISGFGGSQTLTFSVDAPVGLAPRTNTTTVTVAGADNVANIEVTVIVESPVVQLDVPASFSFSGPAGWISPPAVMTLTNSGNVAASYVITDRGMADAGYDSESVDYQWQTIPNVAEYRLDESDLGTLPVEIGFPFMFYGIVRTNVTVELNGTLTFDDGAYINPYAPNLSLDNDASIRVFTSLRSDSFTVTWENMAEPGSAEEDQTFQVVLHRDGGVSYNYRQLRGETLFNEIETIEEVEIFETNTVYDTIGIVTQEIEVVTVVGTNTVITYVDNYNHRSFFMEPGQPWVITYSPYSGTVPAGSTADITLMGDARSLTAGGASVATVNTTLAFSYSGGEPTVGVFFTATNSQETAFADPIMRAAMWGSDASVVSSELNADGSRILSWPVPSDNLNRLYTVEYTTSLTRPWLPLAEVRNFTEYVDDQHKDDPVIFYQVTVE